MGPAPASLASAPPDPSSGPPPRVADSSAQKPAPAGEGAGAASRGEEAAPGGEASVSGEVQGRLTADALSGPAPGEGEERPRTYPPQPQPHPGRWDNAPSGNWGTQTNGGHGLPASPPPPPPPPPATAPASTGPHHSGQWGEAWGAARDTPGADALEAWARPQSVGQSPGASIVLQRQLQSMKEALAVAEATSASLRSQLSGSGGLGSR